MYDTVSRLADAVCRAVELLCNLLLVVMTAVIAMLILSRNLFGFSFSWSEELTRFLLVWLSMLGAAVLLRRDDHIRMELLAEHLPPRARLVLSFLLRLLILAFLVILVQQSWIAAGARAVTHSPALGLSMRIPYLAIPVAAVLMIFVTLVNLWGEALRLTGRLPAPAPEPR
jgi:TRAP-type C4-dicarboxylate transport system permease small subunit